MFFKKQNIELKTEREIEKIRIASKALGEILQKLYDVIKPGITTKDIDIFSEEYIRSLKMIPAFLGVKGVSYPFPSSTCVSINDEVVHGIPNTSRVLKDGDIVSVDVGVIYESYYSDAARTYIEKHSKDYDNNIIRINAATYETMVQSFLELANNLLGIPTEDRNIKFIVRDIYTFFLQREKVSLFLIM